MKKTLRSFLLIVLSLLTVITMLPAISADEADEIEYEVRPVKDGSYTVSAEKYNSYESEHFQILWGDKNNSVITERWLEGNCRILEGCWSLYVDELGMTPPSLCCNKNGNHTTHYKVNVVIMGTGIAGYGDGWAYGGIDSQGYPYLMCCTDAMVYSPETWVTPHEFGHVTQFAQGYNSWADAEHLGPWYEAIGNWFREQYLYSDYYKSNQYYRTDFSYYYLRAISLTAANGRAYYEAWPILQYLTENPDDLPGYGSDFVAKMLQNGSASGYIYNMIEELADADLDETLGYFAAHMATLDLSRHDSYMAKMNDLVASQEFFWQQFYTRLENIPGEEHTYIVPTERAPQEAGYVITPLTITGDRITVTLHGETDIEGAAWSACLVTVKDETCTYSELFGDGETMEADASGVDAAYLTVAATPELSTYKKYALDDDSKLPFSKKNRYPFEAVITGAYPEERVISYTGKGSAHPNGGGFVASTAKVDASVYVGPDAMVLGTAKVKGNARIEDHAVVMGSAIVKDDAVIDGYAVVASSAKISGNAHVGDNAVVGGQASVSGYGQVLESAYVYGSYKITDNAIAKGLSLCLASGQLSGQAVTDGDLYDDSSAKMKKGTVAGYLSMTNSSYLKKLKSTDGLYLGYDFSKSVGITSPELYSSTYIVSRGAEWAEDCDGIKGVYTFDGDSQYMIIDGSAVSFREQQIEINAAADGGNADQKLLYFGDGSGYMYLTPENASGKTEVVITDGNEEVRLTSAESIVGKGLSNIVISFIEGKAALTIDGTTVAVAETTLTPADFSSGWGYIGRGADGDYFDGTLGSVKFYFCNACDVSLEAVAPVPDDTDTTPAVSDTDANVDTDAPDDEPSGKGISTTDIFIIAGGITLTLVLALVLVLLLTKKKSK